MAHHATFTAVDASFAAGAAGATAGAEVPQFSFDLTIGFAHTRRTLDLTAPDHVISLKYNWIEATGKQEANRIRFETGERATELGL